MAMRRAAAARPDVAFVAAMIALAVHRSRQDNPEQVDRPPASVAVDPLASELARCQHHRVGAERIRRRLPPRLGGKPAPVSRAVGPTPDARRMIRPRPFLARTRTGFRPLACSLNAARHADGRHRRHRPFPRGLHPLHRFRLRPARRRGRFHRHHADRHRRDARRAVLGAGAPTRTSSPGSSRRRCSSASSPTSSATGTASPRSSSRALPVSASRPRAPAFQPPIFCVPAGSRRSASMPGGRSSSPSPA